MKMTMRPGFFWSIAICMALMMAGVFVPGMARAQTASQQNPAPIEQAAPVGGVDANMGARVPTTTITDPFTVAGVEVDVTAKNAVEAREQAFAEAQIKAFTQLADRLMPEDQRAAFVAPDAGDISTMINDFEVTQERLSAVRYVGTYTFRFNADYVRQYFNVQGVSYTEISSKPVLVLPFYQLGARNILWRETNPWLQAWYRLKDTHGLVPVAVPLGDIRDVASIGDNEALSYQPAGLADMLDRYGANEAIILIATPSNGGASDDVGLDILMYRTDRSQPEYVTTLKIAASEQGVDAMYDQAVVQVRAALQREWKAQTAVSVTQTDNNVVSVRVPFQTMQQWVETRQALNRVQGVAEMRVRSVTPREARVELVFHGGEDRLRLALSQADLVLVTHDAGPVYGAYDPMYNTPARKTYDLMLKKYRN